MAGITHAKVSTIPDDPTYDIQPKDWNDDHVIPDSVPNVATTATSDMLFGAAGKWVKKTLAEGKALLGIPVTTAASDMMFGSSGDWVKKTLAEAKTLLGLTSATGQMVEVKYISSVPHKQLWIAGWKPTVTAGCAPSAQIEMATNKNVYDYCAFDGGSTDENAYANIPLPQDYTGGAIYAKPYWKHPATTTNFKVAWGLQAVAIDNDGALDVAQGTAQTSLDEGGTTYDLYIGPQTSAITIAGTPAAGKMVNWRCYRDASDTTNDTLAVDAYLLGWMIWYPVA